MKCEQGLSKKLSLTGAGGQRRTRGSREERRDYQPNYVSCVFRIHNIEPVCIKKQVSFWRKRQLVDITKMAVYVFEEKRGRKETGKKEQSIYVDTVYVYV